MEPAGLALTHIPSRLTEVSSASLETLPNNLELEWSWNPSAPTPYLSPSFSLPLARHSHRLVLSHSWLDQSALATLWSLPDITQWD